MRSIEELVKMFVDASMRLEEAESVGNSKIVNQQYDKLRKIREELKEIGDEAMESLISLINHENIYVRYNAAYSIIPVNPEKAKEALNEISNARGLIGFTSKMTLREWENGNLKF
ncbi:MAG TPA: DUF2019 domain-containing protein [Pseudobacteroides sp.]|uniref:DUF2019 domain-containing protein n=1 Tax=Pseudobacteroides sp. TaxID=1968840 RepID=UPI002F926AE2